MKRKLLVITMLAVMIVGVTVGVLVWPEPKEALAVQTYFGVNVEFWDEEIDPDNIHYVLRTYSDQGHLLMVQEEAMAFMGYDQFGFGKWRGNLDAAPEELYWGVFVTFDDPNYDQIEANPFPVQDQVDFGVLNLPGQILQIEIIEP